MRTQQILVAAAILASGIATTGCADTSLRTTAQQRQDLEGIYKLSNGQRARVFTVDRKLYVQIGRVRKEVELVAPYRLASKDGRLTMWYSPKRRGNWIALSYPRQPEYEKALAKSG